MTQKPVTKTEKAVKATKLSKDKEVSAPKGRYIYAVGRRKTSTAKVQLYDGTGTVHVNGKTLKEYFGWTTLQQAVMLPLTLVGAEKNFDIITKVVGGGVSGQADAIAHGLARALVIKDESYKKVLKTNGMLTRDSRMKERKKPGLKKARKSPQWSKR